MGSPPITAADLAAAVDEIKQLIVDLSKRNEEKLSEIHNHIAKTERDQEANNDRMWGRLDKLEDRLRVQEDRSRRNNLLFRGIEDAKGETWAESQSTILDFGAFFKLLDPKNPPEFDRVHRLGLFRQGQCRPIIARCTYYKEKVDLLFKAKNLKGTPFSMAEDFSAETRDIRKELFPHLMEAREKGKKASFSTDKLKIDGKMWTLAALKMKHLSDLHETVDPPKSSNFPQNTSQTLAIPTTSSGPSTLPSEAPSRTQLETSTRTKTFKPNPKNYQQHFARFKKNGAEANLESQGSPSKRPASSPLQQDAASVKKNQVQVDGMDISVVDDSQDNSPQRPRS